MEEIVDIMDEMRFYFAHTRYDEYREAVSGVCLLHSRGPLRRGLRV